MSKNKRNDPCPCGSGKKFKKCCDGKSIKKNIKVLNANPLASAFSRSMQSQQNALKDRKITPVGKSKRKFVMTTESYLSAKPEKSSLSQEELKTLKQVPKKHEEAQIKVTEEPPPYYENKEDEPFKATDKDYRP